MSFVKKVSPSSRVKSGGGFKMDIIPGGTPIGLLLALTYAGAVTFSGKGGVPTSRIKLIKP
jgi:hypothetical protein